MKDKICPVCKKSIIESRIAQGKRVSPSIIKKAVTCSWECRQVYNEEQWGKDAKKDRYCGFKGCGRKLEIKPGEKRSGFLKRLYCNQQCFGMARRGIAINSPDWQQNEVNPRYKPDKKNPVDIFLYW